METTEKHKEILNLLKKEEVATTKISFLISVNYYQTEKFLLELENLNLIERRKENHATYWRLKKDGEKI